MADVPGNILNQLRLICLDLPEASEEKAWTGTRWMVAKKNFAHAVMIENGKPAAYARAAGSAGPLCVLTFRVRIADLASPYFETPPYFRPVWFKNIAGMAIASTTDWDNVARHITESYRILAPKRLAGLIGGG